MGGGTGRAFALISLPFTSQFSVPQGEPGWIAPLYVSACAATTLVVGDIYAATPLLRMVVTMEAGLGFALFSISITYALSVYGALLRATALAKQTSSFIGREAGEDIVDVVCRSVRAQSQEQTRAWFRQTVSDLTTTAQAQAQYPLFAYFHIPWDDRALPIALTDLLELVTVCRALLGPAAFPALTSSTTTIWASRTTTAFVVEHADQLHGGGDTSGQQTALDAYLRTRERLEAAGIALRSDAEAGPQYLEMRSEWSDAAQGLLYHLGYRRQLDA